MGGEEGKINVVSGVSWLHDRLKKTMEDRLDFLKDSVAYGVPEGEYRQFVGRCREARRFINEVLPEMFKEFYAAEEEDDGALGELDE